MEWFIGKADIAKRVEELTDEIWQLPVQRNNTVFLGVLSGAIHFTSDLFRKCSFGSLDFILVKSYIQNKKQIDGKIILTPQLNLEGKDIIVVEDIVDTGKTIVIIEEYLKSLKVNSITIVSFFVKTRVLENKIFQSNLLYGHELKGEEWVVGYGMDDNEDYRWLDSIYLKKSE